MKITGFNSFGRQQPGLGRLGLSSPVRLGAQQLSEPSLAPQTIQPDLFTPSTRLQQQGRAAKRFVVIGDAGSGTADQLAIARQMSRVYQQAPFASVLVLGDNVYENGEPDKFQERIYNPYRDLFQKGVRFYPVLGNHDARKGFGQQQLDYWGAPRFYSVRNGETEFFAIDTTVYLPGYDRCYQDNPFAAKAVASAQTRWLEQALAQSTAKYKIVFGHYPLYSSGLHGNKVDIAPERMRAALEPLLRRQGVNLYLAGHEHHFEKTAPIGGVTHVVTGGGGKEIRGVESDAGKLDYPRTAAIGNAYHFMVFETTDAGLTYEVVSKSGSVLNRGIIPGQSTQLRFA